MKIRFCMDHVRKRDMRNIPFTRALSICTRLLLNIQDVYTWFELSFFSYFFSCISYLTFYGVKILFFCTFFFKSKGLGTLENEVLSRYFFM